MLGAVSQKTSKARRWSTLLLGKSVGVTLALPARHSLVAQFIVRFFHFEGRLLRLKPFRLANVLALGQF
jgi:hypothetical protein